MVHPCEKPCENKTASGYCATTACINPQFSSIGTAQYGQGEQKRIVTNADKLRSMSDEEMAEYLDGVCHDLWQMFVKDPQKMWLDWLRQEVTNDP